MLLLLIVFGENTLIAIIIMIVAVMLQGTVSTGPIASVIDTSPNFSGKIILFLLIFRLVFRFLKLQVDLRVIIKYLYLIIKRYYLI